MRFFWDFLSMDRLAFWCSGLLSVQSSFAECGFRELLHRAHSVLLNGAPCSCSVWSWAFSSVAKLQFDLISGCSEI